MESPFAEVMGSRSSPAVHIQPDVSRWTFHCLQRVAWKMAWKEWQISDRQLFWFENPHWNILKHGKGMKKDRRRIVICMCSRQWSGHYPLRKWDGLVPKMTWATRAQAQLWRLGCDQWPLQRSDTVDGQIIQTPHPWVVGYPLSRPPKFQRYGFVSLFLILGFDLFRPFEGANQTKKTTL